MTKRQRFTSTALFLIAFTGVCVPSTGHAALDITCQEGGWICENVKSYHGPMGRLLNIYTEQTICSLDPTFVGPPDPLPCNAY